MSEIPHQLQMNLDPPSSKYQENNNDNNIISGEDGGDNHTNITNGNKGILKLVVNNCTFQVINLIIVCYLIDKNYLVLNNTSSSPVVCRLFD